MREPLQIPGFLPFDFAAGSQDGLGKRWSSSLFMESSFCGGSFLHAESLADCSYPVITVHVCNELSVAQLSWVISLLTPSWMALVLPLGQDIDRVILWSLQDITCLCKIDASHFPSAGQTSFQVTTIRAYCICKPEDHRCALCRFSLSGCQYRNQP